MADAIGSVLGGLGSGVSDIFSGNLGAAPGALLGGLTTGAGDIGGDVSSLLSGNLGGLFGLSGGGGATSPGTIANTSSSIIPSAPAVSPTAGVSGATPASPSSVAAFAQGPGGGSGVLPIPEATSLAGSAPDIIPGATGGGVPNLAPGLSVGGLSSGGSPSNFLSSVLSNPRLAVSLGALGYDVLGANKNTSQENALKALATQQGNIQQNQLQLAQAEQQGILPQGAESLVQQTLLANEAAIRSKYAELGMSGSTAEVQDIAAAREQAQALAFQIGSGLAQQGFQEAQQATGTQSTLLQQLLQSGLARDQELSQALGAFGAALAPAPQLVYATSPQVTG